MCEANEDAQHHQSFSSSSSAAQEVDLEKQQQQQETKDTAPPTTTTTTAIDDEAEQEEKPSLWTKLVNFYFQYEFLILVVVAILLARAYPPLGAEYLKPEITATWIAVIFIFVLAGLGLKTSEFSKAFQRLYFNAFVQTYNFGFVSAFTYGFSRAFVEMGALSNNLASGMVICASLPMTINMVLVLTKSAGGDEASAIFNAAFGNMVGVFLSPVLILGYLGVTGDIDLAEVFYKLALRVVLPLMVGQLLQKTSKRVVAFVQKHKKWFKKAQMYALVFIVYTVFCKTFENEAVSSVGEIFLMILFQLILLCLFMVIAWYLLRLCFPNEPQLRVMGLFGCTHKTVAMGVPLINAIYEGDPNVGIYTLPLLIWHPMQLVLGTALAPRLAAFVEREKSRLGIADGLDDDSDNNAGGERQEDKGNQDSTSRDEEASLPVADEETETPKD